MTRIGIMGGTFNPIHSGHIKIAQAAYEQYALDRVLFIPSGRPPHKQQMKIASNEDRYNMVCLAISQYPFFEPSRLEIDKEGYSYTYETLNLLNECYSGSQLYFIIGADSLFEFEHWRYPDKILNSAILLVAGRGAYTTESMHKQISILEEKYGGHIHIIDTEYTDISSTSIRNGTYNHDYVPDCVKAYIASHGLYKEG